MVFHGPYSCQDSRRSDKKWTKNNVPDIIKEMKLSDYEATYRAHDPWGYEKVKFVAMSHVHYTLTRKTPRCSVFTWPRGSVINTKQLTVLCKFWNFKGSEFNLFQPCVLLTWMNGFTTVPQYQWFSGNTKTSYVVITCKWCACYQIILYFPSESVQKWMHRPMPCRNNSFMGPLYVTLECIPQVGSTILGGTPNSCTFCNNYRLYVFVQEFCSTFSKHKVSI